MDAKHPGVMNTRTGTSGLTVESARDNLRAGPVYVARERLALTEDRTRLVPDGSPEGRWLWCTVGDEIPREEAIRFGLCTETSDEPPKRGPGRPPGSKNKAPEGNK